jgi:hypothetical protein
MAGLVPAIHVFANFKAEKTWMPGVADKFNAVCASLLWPGMTMLGGHRLCYAPLSPEAASFQGRT